MNKGILSLTMGAALVLTLTACTSGKAPDVTPTPAATPTPVPTANTDKPMTTDNADYEADAEGKVEGTLTPEGKVTNNAVKKAENAVRGAAEDVTRGVNEIMR